MAYDYSGYGKSEGSSSEQEIYVNIEEVAFFATEILNIPTNEIILLGHSLGSAPSIHLAIQKSFIKVKAVILISPIASGVKLVSPSIKVKDLDNIDVFCNINKINDVSCPIFIIHGEKDEVIPISQSKEMVKYMKIPYEWHPRHGDHSNILTRYRTKFFQKCKFFFEFLNHMQSRDTNPEVDAALVKNKEKKTLQREKINKYTDYFNCHFKNQSNTNDEELTHSKVEESYIYIQKMANAYSNSNKDTNDEIVDRFKKNKYENSLSSMNKIDDKLKNSCIGNNLFIEYPESCEQNILSFNCNRILTEGNMEERISKESNMYGYNYDKDLEDQYNKIILKHKGI